MCMHTHSPLSMDISHKHCQIVMSCISLAQTEFIEKVSTPVHVTFADNLTYRAGSARIPFNDEVKQDNPYDIPRDHHDRTLYAIPKSIPASSISSSTYFTNTSSHSETVTSAPYSYFVQPPNSGGKKLPTVVTGGNSYDKPRGHMIMLEKSTPTNTHGNPEYLYMENASETTDGDEHVGGNYDRTMSEVNDVCCHRMNFGLCGWVTWTAMHMVCQIHLFHTLPL